MYVCDCSVFCYTDSLQNYLFPVCGSKYNVQSVHHAVTESASEPERNCDFEPYLSESGHGLAGDDLISAQTGDEAQGLVLVLSAFQLAQDQRSEDLHILPGKQEKRLTRDSSQFFVCFHGTLLPTLAIIYHGEFKDAAVKVL